MTEAEYEPVDRRPIQSRDTRWANRIAQLLVRLGLSPNSISLIGMFAAIAGGVLFGLTSQTEAATQRILWLCAGLLCQVRLLCNLFDGMVAVAQGIASPKGELYNEVPDRISDAAIFIGIGYAAGGSPEIGFTAALLAVFVAYVRAMAKSIGAPNDFCGPMAKPQRMALATSLSAYMAFSPQGWRLEFGEATLILGLVAIGCMVTAIRRLSRASKHLSAAESSQP